MSLLHLHPMLVHFPIALALVAFLFDVSGYRFKHDWLSKAAVALTVLAALGAVASVLSGFFFTKPVAGLGAMLKEEHVTYAFISTLLLIIASVVGLTNLCAKKSSAPKVKLKYLYTFLLLLVAVGISLTGMKGGSIVYDVWLF